jgi:hypothetical protein
MAVTIASVLRGISNGVPIFRKGAGDKIFLIISVFNISNEIEQENGGQRLETQRSVALHALVTFQT